MLPVLVVIIFIWQAN